ncbi:hypothetical protein J2797_004866 [Paraburkholderia terricola]|nr:hypothetical protein [Paraburkholderia terricola]
MRSSDEFAHLRHLDFRCNVRAGCPSYASLPYKPDNNRNWNSSL